MSEADKDELTPARAELTCPHCGERLASSAMFCGKCGQPMAQTNNHPKDFFISYTSEDVGWATWIAQQLEANGYTTIFQRRDFFEGGVTRSFRENCTLRTAVELQKELWGMLRSCGKTSPDHDSRHH